MAKRGQTGADSELFDIGWIDSARDHAQARVDVDGRFLDPSQPAAPAGDLLREVTWVDDVDPPLPTAPDAVPPAGAAQQSQQLHIPAASRVVADHRSTPADAAPTRQLPLAPSATEERSLEIERLRWRELDDATPNAAGRSSRSSSGPVRGQRSFLREWGPVAAGALIMAMLLRTFVVQAFEIPSGSMLPTLEIDDRIVVNQLSYAFGDIGRGEVVVFERPPSMPADPNDADYLVKRVIALPGDTVQLFEGGVWINEMELVETYLADPDSTRPLDARGIPGCVGAPRADVCVVPEGSVFVMGDNRNNSTDSRAAGPISTELVVGRAVVRAWPLNALSWL